MPPLAGLDLTRDGIAKIELRILAQRVFRVPLERMFFKKRRR